MKPPSNAASFLSAVAGSWVLQLHLVAKMLPMDLVKACDLSSIFNETTIFLRWLLEEGGESVSNNIVFCLYNNYCITEILSCSNFWLTQEENPIIWNIIEAEHNVQNLILEKKQKSQMLGKTGNNLWLIRCAPLPFARRELVEAPQYPREPEVGKNKGWTMYSTCMYRKVWEKSEATEWLYHFDLKSWFLIPTCFDSVLS